MSETVDQPSRANNIAAHNIAVASAGLGISYAQLASEMAAVRYESASLTLREFKARQRALRGPQRPAPFPIVLQRRADGFTYITVKGTR